MSRSGSSEPRIGLIGNLENRRIQDFAETCESLGFPRPKCVSYQEILTNDSILDALAEHTVRIDSPGENAEVTRQLIALGKGPKDVQLEFGEIAFEPEYHQGFCKVMDRVKEKGLTCLNAPDDIKTMFDKWACHQLFLSNGVRRPKSELAPSSFQELRAGRAKSGRLFLKPLHGSSASGVCALRWSGDRQVMYAPLRIVEHSLINSLRMQKYETEHEVAFILDRLLAKGMIAEEWIPKWSLEGGVVDVRVLVVQGKARHRIGRQSQHPMTNLHLGNKRCEENRLVESLGPERWNQALELAEKAAACFPRSASAGVDILLDTSGGAWVGEINAFGDLLPGLLHQGETAYEALAQVLCA